MDGQKHKISTLFLFGQILIIGITFTITACNNTPEEIKEEKPQAYSEIKHENREELLDWNKGLVEIDYSVIQKFIERRQWNMQKSSSGLFWQILTKTDGEQAVDGLTAVFSYKTSLLDGTVIYTSEEFGNRELLLGHNQEEAGLDEGLKLMKVGEKARFILPPHLAFGVPGDGFRVPYYSVLVYEIELLEFKKAVTQPVQTDDDGWE
jgi:FKBP-type peptidyl-prolyl cis-trans isomerase FkpA